MTINPWHLDPDQSDALDRNAMPRLASVSALRSAFGEQWAAGYDAAKAEMPSQFSPGERVVHVDGTGGVVVSIDWEAQPTYTVRWDDMPDRDDSGHEQDDLSEAP